MNPVFMIGTQRSGSNLLRLMLNQLKEVASPHPPHILERMCPLMDCYDDLSDDKTFMTLVDDVCRLVELNPVEWSGVSFDRKLIADKATERSLMAVYSAVYELYAESQEAETWCCKSLANIKYIDDINNYFDHPKFIYLYRDGRDVALSFQKAVVGEKHIYNIATNWSDTQLKALMLKDSISEKYFHSVSYEQLTQHPEETARALCEFLNAEYVPEMLDFHKTSEAKNAAKSSELWGNVTSPILKNNSKKYKKEMSEDDVRIFESVAGGVLDCLGYERDHILRGEELKFDTDEIDSFNEKNKKQKMENMKKVDESDKQRRERQAKLLEEIKSRAAA